MYKSCGDPNILGRRERFDAVPFFWTIQYDFGLGYIGHAEHFDTADLSGSLEARDCAITYRRAGQKLAVAIVQRNLVGLRAEVEFERTIDGKEQAETHPEATLVGNPEAPGTPNPVGP